MSRYERNPFERAKGEAPYTVRPTWLASGLLLGLDESDDAVARDGLVVDRWHDTVGEHDPVWILGGVGDPAWLASLSGRLYVVPDPYTDPDDVGTWHQDYDLAGLFPGPRGAKANAHRKDPQRHIMLRAGLGVTPFADDVVTDERRIIGSRSVALDDHDLTPVRLEDA